MTPDRIGRFLARLESDPVLSENWGPGLKNAPRGAFLKFRSEMETNFLEILLGQCQRIACVCQEDIAAMFVDGHIGVFAAFEVC